MNLVSAVGYRFGTSKQISRIASHEFDQTERVTFDISLQPFKGVIR